MLAIAAALTTIAKPTDTTTGNNRVLWVQDFPGMVYDCAFMPDEDYIIDAHDTLLEVRRTVDASLVRSKAMGDLTSLDVSKDGRFVAVAGGSLLKILDINTFETVKDFAPTALGFPLGAAKSVNFSPDGKRLAFVARGYYITPVKPYQTYVLDIETEKVIFQYGTDVSYQDMIHAIFSPDGRWLACDYQGGDDKKIYVFDAAAGFKLHAAFNDDDKTPYGAGGYELIYSPNSLYLLAVGAAGYHYRIWDIIPKIEITPKTVITGAGPLIFLSDNETLYLIDYPLKSYFYNIREQKKIAEFNFAPPIANAALNKNETLILGDRLGLVQIDKSIISVQDDKTQKENDALYPNPASGLVQIKINLPYDDFATIRLFNSNGKLIKDILKSFLGKGLFELNYNVSFLTPGVYFIKITQRDFTKTLKQVKEG